MQRDTRQTLSRAYFDDDQLAAHQLRSFNNFLSSGLQTVVDQHDTIETEIEDSSGEQSLIIEFGDIRVGSPQRTESNGEDHPIYPQESRLRNLTYSAPIVLEMRIIVSSDEDQEKHVFQEGECRLGRLPVMVRSNHCNLHGLSAAEQRNYGEDPLDPGAYFIVNGSERVLVTHEDLAHGGILTESQDRTGKNKAVAKTISEHEGHRSLTTVELTPDNLIAVSFPDVPGSIDLPIVLNALGLETDEEISSYFADSPDIMKFVLAQLETTEITAQDAALKQLGKILAPEPYHDSDYRRTRARNALNQHLLSHFNDDQQQSEAVWRVKANHLCRMAEACFEMVLGHREPDDKDHYKNKRLKTAGDLMQDLFRAALNRLGRDMKYHAGRAHIRERRIEIETIVRGELITSRLEQALATGAWTGGRSGVSQLVDRTNQMGIFTQLRRVQSPLARSRPHFDARDLHATQWGRLCPSETPEGQNCGLVKNLAQAGELSTAISDEETLTDSLIEMGVEPI